MNTTTDIGHFLERDYTAGFVTDIEADAVPPGLSEDVIRLISAKKGEPEFMLNWRLEAYRHWLKMTPPEWAHVHYPPVDFQDIVYYSAPKQGQGPKAWTRSTRNCWRPSRSSASRCTSALRWPA
jgi:Fe-S cluster assembly protein SufB